MLQFSCPVRALTRSSILRFCTVLHVFALVGFKGDSKLSYYSKQAHLNGWSLQYPLHPLGELTVARRWLRHRRGIREFKECPLDGIRLRMAVPLRNCDA
jgi:hypothetical protein